MKHLIIAARDKAARAAKAAQDIGAQIREKQAKGETVGDLEASFDKAHADAVAALKDVTRIEQEAELAERVSHFTTPAEGQAAHRDGTTTVVSMTAEQFKAAHREAFRAYVLHGAPAAVAVFEKHKMEAKERHALLTSDSTLGGFLAPDEMRMELVKDEAGIAVMRRICRVETTGAPALVFPTLASATTNPTIYSTGYTGSWRAEGAVGTDGTAPAVQDQPTFGQARVPVYMWQPDAVVLTPELLDDAKANVEAIIGEAIREVNSLDEDAAFTNGTGASQPLGLTNAGITEVKSGSAAALAYGGLIDLFTGLPAQYRRNATWLMNSLTYGKILKLADDQKMPIIPVNSLPNTLWGRPIEFNEFLPDVAADAYPIYFGNFRYYVIADRQDLRIQRLVEKYAPNTGLLPTARKGGRPVRLAAFRRQKVAA